MTAPSLPAAPGSRRPAKPRRSWLLPAGLLAGLLLTIWSAVGIGLEPLSLLQDAGRGLRIIGEVLTPNWAFLPQTIDPLIQTFQMAVIASIVGCGIGLPVAFLASRVTSQPIPGYTKPNLCPDKLIDATSESRKSHMRSGCTNGAINPPLAASIWRGMAGPPCSRVSRRSSFMSAIGSISPVKVVPKIAPTQIVFSSMRSLTSSTVTT